MQWEVMLLALLVGIFIMNMNISPHFLNAFNMFTHINTFLVSALVALPMAYVLLMGEIDLSVGGTVVLSATILGIVFNATGSMPLAILAALVMGTICGAINGFILIKFPELSAMIVTLATMIFFRGVSERILGQGATGGMRTVSWFAHMYDGRIGPVPYLFFLFMFLAAIFYFVMHKTTFGRHMFAIGANRMAAEYAGINVKRTRLKVFTLTGLMGGLSAVFYCAWMGTVRSNIAEGYEIEAIAMCVLGGMSTAGGKGNFLGVVIAIFIFGLLRFGLALVNVTPQTVRIIIGMLLVVVVITQNARQYFNKKPALAN